MFFKMPFILAFIIAAIILLDPFIPIELKSACYAISLTIKSIIIFSLPLIIFGLLFKMAVTLSKQATWVIIMIFLAVCCSNFISTFLSHYVGMWIYSFDLSLALPNKGEGLEPLWHWELPKLIANDKAMLAGIILGIFAARLKGDLGQKIANYFEQCITKILNSFTYLIPLFVAGFVVKMQFEGIILQIFKEYTSIFAIIALAQFSYICLAYFIMYGRKRFLMSLKNMLPAAICGFSTMSSAASMPLTIMGAENNANNKALARSVIPATVNIHLVGDCFAIPIFAYAVLKNFSMAEPALLTYLIFSFYFVMAKFSVAAIPGGGIIVMLPILESYLGFNAEMMSLITALYILFDPVITCANVLGNGAFAKMIERLSRFKNQKESIPIRQQL
jgi:Na+/H+-dicarboxylate symporter